MTDRDLRLFSLLTDVSDELVEESMIPPTARVAKPRRERGWLSDFMSSPVAAAVLSAVVALTVLAAIVAAGRHGPGTTPVSTPGDQLFYVGMSYENMMAELDDYPCRDPFQYGSLTFVSFQGGDQFLLITCGLTDEGGYAITDIRTYAEETPTHEDFDKIEVGMDIHRVTELVGRPEGSYTSGANTLAYRTVEDDLYYIYLHGEGGTVSEVVWTNPDPLYATVTFPAGSSRQDLYYAAPEKVARFHDYFKQVYTTYVYDELPVDKVRYVCTVTITYEGGRSSSYMVNGDLISYDGGETWAKIQEYQPHVDTTLEELIESTPADTPSEVNVFVLWVDQEGFWGYFADIDAEVYVKVPHDFQVFDTVRVQYYPAQLKKEEGTLGGDPNGDGTQSFHYSYVLENPVSTKLSGPQMKGQ